MRICELWRWWIQQHYHLKNWPPAPFLDWRDTRFENVFARMFARTFETRAARRREPPRVVALMRIRRLASPSRASPYHVGELVCARRRDAVVPGRIGEGVGEYCATRASAVSARGAADVPGRPPTIGRPPGGGPCGGQDI